MAESILKYVQIESNAALIDSRVYCRDIIEVDHHDWLNNILKKYKTFVESRFGIVRFENALSGKVGMPEKYALLTEAQCNAYLVFSRNSQKIVEKKLDLIADFEAAKNQIRASFNRLLSANPETEALKTRVAFLEAQLNEAESKVAFPRTLTDLHEISGIVNKSQVKGAVLLSFVESEDYLQIEDEVLLSDDTFNILVMSFRSHRGTDIDRLPAIIKMQTRKFYQYRDKKSKNNRTATRDKEVPGQTNIFDYLN